jgi:rubrerythrin
MALPDTTSSADNSAPTPESVAPASDSATTPSEVVGYCVKCKASRNMTQVEIVTTQNKRKAAKGKCPVCGTTMNKFLPNN